MINLEHLIKFTWAYSTRRHTVTHHISHTVIGIIFIGKRERHDVMASNMIMPTPFVTSKMIVPCPLHTCSTSPPSLTNVMFCGKYG